jgi:hypothetical protein
LVAGAENFVPERRLFYAGLGCLIDGAPVAKTCDSDFESDIPVDRLIDFGNGSDL